MKYVILTFCFLVCAQSFAQGTCSQNELQTSYAAGFRDGFKSASQPQQNPPAPAQPQQNPKGIQQVECDCVEGNYGVGNVMRTVTYNDGSVDTRTINSNVETGALFGGNVCEKQAAACTLQSQSMIH